MRAFHYVEKLLDGTRTVDEITSLVDADLQPTTVVFLLKLLHGKGLLQHGDDAASDGDRDEIWHRQVRFLSHFVPNAARAQSELAKAQVGVVGAAGLQRGDRGRPENSGHERHRDDRTADRTSARPTSSTSSSRAGCRRRSRSSTPSIAACLATRTRWLRVAVSGLSAQLGPTFVPFETACHTCLELQAADPRGRRGRIPGLPRPRRR